MASTHHHFPSKNTEDVRDSEVVKKDEIFKKKWKELKSVILSKETQAQQNTGSMCYLTFSSQFLTGKYGYLAGSKCEPKQRTYEGEEGWLRMEGEKNQTR